MYGFAVNHLSGVAFAEEFAALGYETKPPKDFGFTKRNIHFAAACLPGAKQRLPVELKRILGPAIPDKPGMVRLCSNPPSGKAQSEICYEDCYSDVPAVNISRIGPESVGIQPVVGIASVGDGSSDAIVVPLVVEMDKPYTPSGKGVVSHRTAHHVGHNGYEFCKLNAFPELRNSSSELVRGRRH